MITLRTTHRGYILLVALVFFAIFLTVASALVGQAVAYGKTERHTIAAAQAQSLAEAGIDQAGYQLNLNPSYTGETNTALGNGTFTVVVTSIDSATKQVVSTGTVTNAIPSVTRTVRAKFVKNGNFVTFKYGTQAGQGGIIFANNSALEGNLFANGPIVGANGAYITGDVSVASSTGSISSMCIGGTSSGGSCLASGTSTGSAYAHTITNTSVTGSLYCQTGSGNNKACNTSVADQNTEPLPVSDSTITGWKSDAAAGTTINGNLTLSSSTTTLGPTKIIGNLTISGTAQVTIASTVWVTGNVTFSGSGGGSRVKLANTFGSQSGLILSDGLISIGNNVAFQNSGTSGSYIMLLSTSNCDESMVAAPCNSTNAIEISNNADIVIANAEQGTVDFANNASVKEVVGNKIRLKNNVKIQYGSGLPSTLFQSGPGGSWVFEPGTYSLLHQ